MGKKFRQTLHRRRYAKVNKHVRRCLASLVVWGMLIKVTKSYHCIPTRMTVIKKIHNTKCWPECRAAGPLILVKLEK